MERTTSVAASATSAHRGAGFRYLPGLAVSVAVAVASLAVAAAETRLVGHPVVEALVVALILGMLVRVVWQPGAAYQPGISFASKQLLELAIVLLGASVDVGLLVRAGPALGVAIVAVVACGLAFGVIVARALGLRPKLAVLVATGNAICGNSAIAAVAPVIGADADDVAASVAFTAVLGVTVVLALPLLIAPLGLTHYQYGVLAGLSVYAVPQVLAAAFPVSALSGDVATFVKLVRVLMLGPIVVMFALWARRHARVMTATAEMRVARSLSVATLVPWFIVGFLVVAAFRAFGGVPDAFVAPARLTSTHLTVVAMAALGLSADLRAVAAAGARVAVAVTLSLVLLVALGIGLIAALHIR